MQWIIDWFYRFLGLVLTVLLAGMVVMVFGNVVLRYAFNTGWMISEELSRFFFVWLTFTGAVLTFKEHSHMGIETLTSRLSRRGQLLCMAATNLIIMACAYIFAAGTWEQLEVNATMYAPVTGLSLAWVYGIGMFTGAGVFVIAGFRLLTVLTGKVSDEELDRFAGGHGASAE